MIDYYHILKIQPNATHGEIKKAYRRQAKIWHPDINKTPEAEQKFRDIHTAYTVLGNTVRRTAYDIGLNYLSTILIRRNYQRQREKIQNRHQNTALILISLLILLSFIYSPLKTLYYKVYLGTHYSTAWAEFYLKPEKSLVRTAFTYSYTVDGELYEFTKEFSYNTFRNHFQSPTKFPVFEGSRFQVRHNSGYPKRHYINYKQPHPDDLEWLMSQCINLYCQGDKIECNHKLQKVYKKFGIKGLLSYYYSDIHPLNQLKYNSNTYKRMMRKLD